MDFPPAPTIFNGAFASKLKTIISRTQLYA